jgi:hypothetical protein
MIVSLANLIDKVDVGGGVAERTGEAFTDLRREREATAQAIEGVPVAVLR